MTTDATTRQKAHPAYLGLLGSQTILLAVVGWFSVATVTRVEGGIDRLITAGDRQAAELAKTNTEVAALRATVDAWAKQNFVPRDLFDRATGDYERRFAALEKK